jgi:hypothetical protein
MCNQAIHEIDIARWFLNTHEVAPEVMSIGGRLSYSDCGETPNSFLAIYNYAAAPLIAEVRGLTSDGTLDGPMDRIHKFSKASIGIVVECENATIIVPDYHSAKAYDASGAVIKSYGKEVSQVDMSGGASSHHANWIECIRAGSNSNIHAPLHECHISTNLVHAANISYRLGAKKNSGEITDAIKSSSGLSEAYNRMKDHLGVNGIKVDQSSLTLGTPLSQDPKTELFTGANSEAANRDLVAKREGRAGFKIPTKF